MPSKKVLNEKKAVVSEIESKIKDAKTIVLFDYRGLTDNDTKVLRNKLRDTDSDYKVYKNTLLKLAFKDMNIDLANFLEGPTAIAFSKEDIPAVKVLADTAKEKQSLILKAGVVDGTVCDTAKIAEFASIPSREGLYTMLAGGMIQIVKDLSIALDLYSKQKEN